MSPDAGESQLRWPKEQQFSLCLGKAAPDRRAGPSVQGLTTWHVNNLLTLCVTNLECYEVRESKAPRATSSR